MTESKFKQTRDLQTRWTVKAADKIAKFSITIGGIGTILAVSAVCVFLVAVVIPIFVPGSADEAGRTELARDAGSVRPGSALLHMALDEYRVMGWTMIRDGNVHVFRLDSGATLDVIPAVNGDSLSSWSFGIQGDDVAFGFLDGTIRLGRIGFDTDFPSAAELPEHISSIGFGEVRAVDNAVIQKTPEGQLRRQRLVVEIDDPLPAMLDTSVVLLDHYARDDRSIVCALTADGKVHIHTVERFENWMTGEIEFDVSGSDIRTEFLQRGRSLPSYLAVAESGTSVHLVWDDGTVTAYDTRDSDNPRVAGEVDMFEGEGGEITALSLLLGGATFLVGDAEGSVGAWFEHKVVVGDNEEFAFSAAHRFKRAEAPVTALSSSPRSRVFAAGYGNGSVRIFHATSEATIIDVETLDGSPIIGVAVAPKNDGLAALTATGVHQWDVDLKHPEATFKSLFLPKWYEGYNEPEHVWQSSSGTDDFEPKFGLWPLIFGTLKATFYSMLFGVPLALLAAIFTSEFMSPAVRPRVKTLIESMASLPSVVLGFLAALVFAPFVQRVVPAALVGYLVIPGLFLIAAYLWQLLPHDLALRLSRFRLSISLALLPLGVLASAALGPWVEALLFEGDIALWLDGGTGSGFGGWLLMLIPLCAFFAVWFLGTVAGPLFAKLTEGAGRRKVGVLDLGRFAAGIVLTVGTAAAASALLVVVGADPRGPGLFLDTYVQRNALVVGFVMGFAIIPIIYTIAEDALSAVPEHLRAASLGAGATPWQTAVRIVLPTAMSGLFSAVMIGLGRAVGETMIVLMAAGNTPLLEMNIFNGFRTLSANIAVELPEAVRDSTHYRILFLAALILFAMTFTVNTIAEMVRLRFRRRAAQI
jgi:phosphate transport system permease protein